MLKVLRGTKDILPKDMEMWQYIESSARKIFTIFGYREIRTPIIEEASLFIRGIGDGTDIVQKEMYVFSDRGGRTVALRPEATASVVRAYIENYEGLEPFIKLFYMGPMFRSERPQKGRQRQFHQLGVEVIGSDNPFLDVEVILLAVRFMDKLRIEDFSLKINSLGCPNDKLKIIEKHKKSIEPYLGSLCSECKERYSRNILRIFDCKNAGCRKVVAEIKAENLLCRDCTAHFKKVQDGLTKLGIDYVVDTKIVRGLDYYTKTVFEIVQGDLGAKDAICAGGRYNNLIKDMGGKDSPAVGFAFGIERLILAGQERVFDRGDILDFFIVTTNENLYEEAFVLMNRLRDAGYSCDTCYEKKSLKAQMRRAQRSGAKFVIIFGEEEFQRHKIILRDMEKREQKEVGLEKIIEEIGCSELIPAVN